jgi:hypothetical protein
MSFLSSSDVAIAAGASGLIIEDRGQRKRISDNGQPGKAGHSRTGTGSVWALTMDASLYFVFLRK